LGVTERIFNQIDTLNTEADAACMMTSILECRRPQESTHDLGKVPNDGTITRPMMIVNRVIDVSELCPLTNSFPHHSVFHLVHFGLSEGLTRMFTQYSEAASVGGMEYLLLQVGL
jgi:hypothetical protein